MELAGEQAKPISIFRLATGLFYKNTEKCTKRMDLAEQIFKLRGGKIKETFDDQLSHIFIGSNEFNVDNFLIEFNVTKDAIQKVRIVVYEWIVQCYNKGKKCNAKPFQIVI